MVSKWRTIKDMAFGLSIGVGIATLANIINIPYEFTNMIMALIVLVIIFYSNRKQNDDERG